MSKIMIAIPCMDSVPTPFAQSLAMIRKPDNDQVACAFQMGSLIYTSRNALATQAVLTDFDYVFWLDSDMVFNQDILVDMKKVMDENDLDILSGLYFRRVPPFTPVIFDKLEITDDGRCEYTEFEEIPRERFEVGGCGFGGLLIRGKVLEKVREEYGGDYMFTPYFNMGEDLSFCWRARELGFKIWCDPQFVLGHVGYSVINRKFYESYSSVKSAEEEKK